MKNITFLFSAILLMFTSAIPVPVITASATVTTPVKAAGVIQYQVYIITPGGRQPAKNALLDNFTSNTTARADVNGVAYLTANAGDFVLGYAGRYTGEHYVTTAHISSGKAVLVLYPGE